MDALSVTRHPLYLLTLARLRTAFREPSTIFWSFGFPIILTIALGIAFRSRPPEPVAVVVEQGEGAPAAQQALAAATGVSSRLLPHDEAQRELNTGKAALLVVPGSPRTYAFDPQSPESRLARAVVDDALQRAEGRQDATPTAEKHVSEQGSRYVDFVVPGLIGSNVMSAGMWGIGYVIVETRTRRLLKRMISTPMRRSHFLLSFVLMRMLFLAVELPVLLVFAWAVFGVAVRGSVLLLALLVLLGALAFSGVAMLIASRARNTETVTGLINLIQMPMFLLSGVFFSYARFPEAVQPLIRLLPLTALLDGMRAVMNEGAGVQAVAPQVLLLAGTAVATFVIGLKLFRWS
ncbi:MAG: ABC transporter permease [Deltaproteobacteria bacterium]|nr:ABC transporter permease [Deltaproteobacteria bacterium]